MNLPDAPIAEKSSYVAHFLTVPDPECSAKCMSMCWAASQAAIKRFHEFDR